MTEEQSFSKESEVTKLEQNLNTPIPSLSTPVLTELSIPLTPVKAQDRQSVQTEEVEPSKIRISLDVSPELYQSLSYLARNCNTTKSEVLRKAIALMEIAFTAKQNGQKLGLVEKTQRVKTEIVGI